MFCSCCGASGLLDWFGFYPVLICLSFHFHKPFMQPCDQPTSVIGAGLWLSYCVYLTMIQACQLFGFGCFDGLNHWANHRNLRKSSSLVYPPDLVNTNTLFTFFIRKDSIVSRETSLQGCARFQCDTSSEFFATVSFIYFSHFTRTICCISQQTQDTICRSYNLSLDFWLL